MKRVIYLLAAACCFYMASCQTQEVDIVYPEGQDVGIEMTHVIITAELKDADSETRTARVSVDEKYKTYWTPGDQVKVFSNGQNSVFTAINTEACPLPGPLANLEGSISYVTGVAEESEDQKHYVWGLYPYREDATYSEPDGISRTAWITTTLPDMQTAKADTYDDGYALTIGRSTTLSIPFMTGYSGFYVKFNRSDVISVTLRGLDGEYLAGKVSYSLDSEGHPIVKEYIDPSTSVTLYAKLGETFEAGRNYYLVTLPDISIHRGVEFTVRTSGGLEGTYTLESTKSFTRTKFRNLTDPLDYRIENYATGSDWHASSTQGLNEIWYTTTDGSAVGYSGTGNPTNIAPADNNGIGILRFNSTVTQIPANAFSDQTTLSSVTLPEQVIQISSGAFSGCTSLSQVTMRDQVQSIFSYAFENCAFQNIHLSENLTFIGSEAFALCQNLETITIPESVTVLGWNPFEACSSLTGFYGKFASADHKVLIKSYDSQTQGETRHVLVSFAPGSMLTGTYTLPDEIDEVGAFAFVGASITGIDLNDVPTIGRRAFMNCRSLTSLVIPESVSTIGEEAFLYCAGLNTIRIQNARQLPTGGTGMFDPLPGTTGCPIFIPAAWLQVYQTTDPWSQYADRYQIILAGNQISYTTTDGQIANFHPDHQGWVIENTYDDGFGLITVKDTNGNPVNLTDLENYSFQYVTNLKTVSLPDCMETIWYYAFEGATSLTNVYLGTGIRTIRQFAFSGCNSLTDIYLPEGLNTIAQAAFAHCTSLQTVTLPSTLESIAHNSSQWGSNPFLGCTSLTGFYGSGSGFRITPDHKFLLSSDGTYLISGAIGGFVGQDCAIPNGVTEIGFSAFLGGTSHSVYFPNSIQILDDRCFKDYTVTGGGFHLGRSLTKVRQEAFSGFQFISTQQGIWLDGDYLPEIGWASFGGSDTVFPIYITGTSAAMSEELLITDGQNWASYWNSGRVSPYQAENEIWYHRTGTYTSLGNGLNFGTADNPVAASGGNLGFIIGSNVSCAPCVAFPANSSFDRMGIIHLEDPAVTVPANLFQGMTDLDYVSLPNTVQTIGANAFRECSALSVFPVRDYNQVNRIEQYAFYRCTVMGGSVPIPGVSYLGIYAFTQCKNITDVELGPVTSIRTGSFYGCTALSSVVLKNPEILTEVASRAFTSSGLSFIGPEGATTSRLENVTSIGIDSFNTCQLLQAIEVPNLVTLGNLAFTASGLRSFEAPNLRSVGEQAFMNCTGLLSVKLMRVETLNSEVFRGTWHLEELHLGSYLNSIGAYQFYADNQYGYNHGTLKLYLYGNVPETIASTAFLYNGNQTGTPSGPFLFKEIHTIPTYEQNWYDFFTNNSLIIPTPGILADL